jgi:PadR family transcriptional regulator, regulatory protein AphA
MQLVAYERFSMSLRHVLLTMLLEKPATGYELTQTFEEQLRYFWQATHQQVYRELAGLLADGFVKVSTVAQDDKPDKKIYRIARAGERALSEWLRTPPAHRPVNDGVLIRLLSADLLGRKEIIVMLERERQNRQSRLSEYQAIERTIFPSGATGKMDLRVRGKYLALRKGIRMEKARMEWTEEAIALLR